MRRPRPPEYYDKAMARFRRLTRPNPRPHLKWLLDEVVYAPLEALPSASLEHALYELILLAAPGWSPDRTFVTSSGQRFFGSEVSHDTTWERIVPAPIRAAFENDDPKAQAMHERWWGSEVREEPVDLLAVQRRLRGALEALADGRNAVLGTDVVADDRSTAFLHRMRILGHTYNVSPLGVRWSLENVSSVPFLDAAIIAVVSLATGLPRRLLRRCSYSALGEQSGVTVIDAPRGYATCGRVFVGMSRQKYCGPHQGLAKKAQRTAAVKAFRERKRAAKTKRKGRKR